MTTDEKYMSRALRLAMSGAGHVSPNPMVGALIVAPDGRVIGEGYHRRFGEAHAEVNAVASVADADMHLLPLSTFYVTLEPCSHYGKTPPCAELLCRHHPRRVVVGTIDPNPRVAGRGIKMLQDAGIEVVTDVLADECRHLNRRFFTSQVSHRPWILLKWAETAAGEMCLPDGSPIPISSPLTKTLMHRQRSLCDAIMVGTNTLLHDNPSLDNRLWPGNSPRPVIFASDSISPDVAARLRVYQRDPIILDPKIPLEHNMKILFEDYHVSSLMVEGGRRLLDSFIQARLYDEIRVERSF
ncbi:MAG: bifunctional diaminohydroxyphosphoribosylaminopyrimidine deaminase/5-amino-6-(5-phosphoribosylamino)uracil reductase RibD [Lepagella sp.]